MEETVQHSPIDTTPQRSRPGLALVLALLAVPGSTVAWSLPAGGLWIGLPLAVAAIVLGVRARRELSDEGGSRMATAAIVISALAIGQMAAWFIVEAVS